MVHMKTLTPKISEMKTGINHKFGMVITSHEYIVFCDRNRRSPFWLNWYIEIRDRSVAWQAVPRETNFPWWLCTTNATNNYCSHLRSSISVNALTARNTRLVLIVIHILITMVTSYLQRRILNLLRAKHNLVVAITPELKGPCDWSSEYHALFLCAWLQIQFPWGLLNAVILRPLY